MASGENNPESDGFRTKVSVVIPFYNAAEYIAPCLESVFSQEYPQELLEIILVDDGSSDDSSTRISEASERADRAIRVLQTKQAGPSAARNFGWREAKGSWIQFLDADDLLHPKKILRQVQALESGPLTVGVYYSDWAEFQDESDIQGNRCKLHRPDVDGDPQARVLIHDHFLQIGSQVISKAALRSVNGFDESIRLIEDVELNFRLAVQGWQYQKVELSEPGLYFRAPLGYEQKYDKSRFLESVMRNAEAALEYWLEEEELSQERIDVLCDIFQPVARQYSAFDLESFHQVVDRIEQIAPGYIARNSAPRAFLSKLFGYRTAERIAALSRKIRRLK